MAVDEALVTLAEAVLLAGFLVLASRLWSAKYDPYPQLIAQLINSSPPDAEVFYALPKPVRVEGDGSYGRVCQAGECHPTVPVTVDGKALDWFIIHGGYVLGSGSAGPQASTTTLTVQVYRVSSTGAVLGPAAGVRVAVDSSPYLTDSSGRVSVQVLSGAYHLVEILDSSFLRWSDGDASSSKAVKVSTPVTLTAYVRG